MKGCCSFLKWLVSEDGLQFQKFLQSRFAPLATVARLFITSKTTGEIHPCAIDVYVSRANSSRHSTRPLQVSRAYIAGKPIGSVVSDAHRILLALIRNNAKHRPENFLPRNSHLVSDVAEHRGSHEISFDQAVRTSQPSTHQSRAFVDTRFDQPLHLLKLSFAGEWAHRRAFAERISHLDAFGSSLRNCARFIHSRSRHQHSCRRVAGLPRVAEASLN